MTYPSAEIPDDVARLFWDVDPRPLDRDKHRDYIMERVMARGGWNAMRWLRAQYDLTVLREFLERRGQRLPARELAYWALITGAEIAVPRGGGRPHWAGP
jgi:hypothetical protein